MIRGKITIVFAAALFACVAVAVTGCGNSDNPSPTKTADAANASGPASGGGTSKTGGSSKGSGSKGASAAAGAAPKKTRAQIKQERENKKRAERSIKDLNKREPDAGPGPAPGTTGGQASLSASEKDNITAAVNQWFNALSEDNIGFVCAHSYAPEYINHLSDIGGCNAITKKFIGNTQRYKVSIGSIGPYNNQDDLAQIYMTITMESAAGNQTVSTLYYFRDVDGAWKRTLDPTSQSN